MVSSPFKATPHIALQRNGNGVLALDAPNGGLTTFEPSDHFGPRTPLLWGGTTTLHATRGIALNGGIATFEPSGRFVPRAPLLRVVGWRMGEGGGNNSRTQK